VVHLARARDVRAERAEEDRAGREPARDPGDRGRQPPGEPDQGLQRPTLARLLEARARLGRDRSQPCDRVGEPDRKGGSHHPDPVPRREPLPLVPDVHRHGGPHAQPGERHTSALETAPERTGDHGEQDVVHLAARRGAQGEEVVEGKRRPAQPAGARERPVQRQPRRRVLPRAGEELSRRLHRADDPRGVEQRAEGLAERLEGPPAWLAHATTGRHASNRIGQPQKHLRAACTVDHAVVDLPEQRGATVGEPVDQAQLPQRVGGIERRRVEPVEERVQLLGAAGRRHCGMMHVAPDVEAPGLRPVRPAEIEGRTHRPLTATPEETQALLHGTS
jgi:hypothetical protein